MTTHIYAQSSPWNKRVELLICADIDGKRSIARQVVMDVVEDYAYLPEPTLSLLPAEAQELMDGLWNCGYRPSEGSGSAGSLAATERHLQDMRKLVFKENDNATMPNS